MPRRTCHKPWSIIVSEISRVQDLKNCNIQCVHMALSCGSNLRSVQADGCYVLQFNPVGSAWLMQGPLGLYCAIPSLLDAPSGNVAPDWDGLLLTHATPILDDPLKKAV